MEPELQRNCMVTNQHIKLTVVTAVRNLIEAGRGELIKRCIDSVAMQETGDWNIEHIVADGASTDGTLELLKKLQEDYRFRIVSKPDKQVFEGMNNGLEEAQGTFVLFLNSDDVFVGKTALAKSVELWDENNADVGYADTYLVKPNSRHRRRQHSDINKLPFQDHFIHQSMATRTVLMKDVGGFDISLPGTCLENDLTMRFLKMGKKFVRSPYCFCAYSLDGMTGRGTGRRSMHPDFFLKHFGSDLGLTLEECIGLRYFVGISYWSEDECRDVLGKLEARSEWAAIWRHQIELHFKNGQRILPPLWYRVKCRWEEFGFEGILESIKKRIGRVI